MRKVFSLFLIQGVNYLAPLLLIPVLAHRLGDSGWGKISLMLVLSTCSLVFVEFAFHLSGVRACAACHGDRERLNRLFANVFLAKSLLGLIAVLPALAIYLVFFSTIFTIQEFWWWLLAVIVQSHTCAWFFQGQQRNNLGYGLESGSRILSMMLTCLLVWKQQDIWKYFLSIFLGWIPAIIFWWQSARLVDNIKSATVSEALDLLRKGRDSFVLHMWGTLFVSAPPIILSKFSTLEQVGYFTIADKLVRAFYGLYVPIHTHLFPKVAALTATHRTEAAKIVKNGLYYCFAIGVILAALIFSTSHFIIVTVFGKSFREAASTLQAMSLMPMLIVASSIVVLQWMVNLHVEKLFNRWNLTFGIMKIGLSIFVSTRFGSVGVASVVILSDFTCLVVILIVLNHLGISPFVESRSHG